MATYFTPRPQLSSSHNANPPPQETGRRSLPNLDLTVNDHSIYIFPDPTAELPSPASALFSPATSFDASSPSIFSVSSRSRSQRRVRHHASSFSTQSGRSPSIGQASSGSPRTHSYFVVDNPSPISPTYFSVENDPDVGEVWDGLHSPLDDEASRELEERVERVSRWDFDSRLRQFVERAAAASIPAQERRRRLAPLRTRTRTSSQSLTSNSLASSRPTRARSSSTRARAPSPSPQPRIRIPFLSFFAGLLALDLDDPALRLLTQSAPADADSILFPGHSATRLLQSLDGDRYTPPSSLSSPDSDEETKSVPVHGFAKLLSSANDPSGAALRSLRAGLAMASLPSELVASVPGARGLAGLWRAVGEVYARGGQAWREVWVGS